MRRFKALFFSLLAIAALSLVATPVSAGSVDPSTLQPPAPTGAHCHDAGSQTICDTTLDFDLLDEPFVDAPCGTLYMTGTDERDGTRWYTDGLLTHRHVVGALNARLTLSSDGEGPSLVARGHWNWWSVWAVPGGSEDEAVVTESGLDLQISGPGIGSRFHISGRFLPDGTTFGRFTGFSEDALAALCQALGQ